MGEFLARSLYCNSSSSRIWLLHIKFICTITYLCNNTSIMSIIVGYNALSTVQ